MKCVYPTWFVLTLAIVSLCSITRAVAEVTKTTPVSVAKFSDKSARSGTYSGDCQSLAIWWDSLGDAFSDLLIEKLESNPKLEVLERETIAEIYSNEVNLENSDDTSIERRKFKKAKITFVGVVDGFEYCSSGSAGKIDVGSLFGAPGIKIGAKTNKATVSVLIRAIDTATGKILATGRAKKEQNKTGIGLSVDSGPIDLSGSNYKQSALGEAIHDAIFEATNSILEKLKI